MRKKMIRAFLGVYLAVCVTYGVVRGVTAPAIAEDEPMTDVPPEQTTSEPVIEPKTEIEELIDKPVNSQAGSASGEMPSYTYTGRRGRGRGRKSGSFEMEAPAAETNADVPDVPSVPDQSDTEEEAGDGEEKEAGQENATAPAVIPTLEEYLKNLHCGGCGRNCFLLNPHCMRGARKEAQAESAYFQQYSEVTGEGL